MSSIAQQNRISRLETEVDGLKAQIAALREDVDRLASQKRGPGRPRKEEADAEAHEG